MVINWKRYKSTLLIILIVVFSVLHKANRYGLVLFDYTLGMYMLIWAACLLFLQFIFKWILSKNEGLGTIITVFIALFLLNFGEVQDFFFNAIKSPLLASTWVLFGGVFLLSVAAWMIYRKRNVLNLKLYNFILLLFSLFIVVELFKIKGKGGRFYDISNIQPKISNNTKVNAEKPDIYFLVFDSYTSGSVLDSFWHFSNNRVDSFLTQYGFKITRNAHSAYNFTPLSINSTLNLNYLSIPQQAMDHDYINFNYGIKIFNDAFLFHWLRQQGYSINCYSILSPSFNNNQFYPFFPDKPLHWLRRQTVERIWVTPSLWSRALAMIGLDKKYPEQVSSAFENLRKYNQSLLDSITKAPSDTRPGFVYAHFNLPHAPYMYRRDGSARSISEALNATKQQQMAYYLDHIIYANSFIQQIVSEILKNGKKNKVVIIQGDHGYRDYVPGKSGDQLAIFNAVYFPDGDYSQISDTTLSVNNFRILLNKYFNQNLPLLSQRKN